MRFSKTLILILCSVAWAADAAPGAALIPESKIASLQAELTQHSKATSSTRMRRACKSIVRKGAALIDASPAAPNRFRVLAIVLQSQKRLLALESSDRNRKALFETCDKLVKAPDAYADLRLEADFLLSEKNLALKNADVKERAKALAALIKRYRDTSTEAKSLMIASKIAPKLDAFDLEKTIIRTLIERFQGDHNAIEFRRKNLNASQLDVLFRGTYKRTDGSSLSFPIDRMGHTCLMYFWSKETKDIEQRLAEAKAMQTRFPGQFEVYSFNLDQLPDAGEKMLRRLGLDWTALHLPGGKMNSTYRAYAKDDPGAVLVNAHGHALLVTAIQHKGTIPLIPRFGSTGPRQGMAGSTASRLEQCLDNDRYLTQLQSLFIGDFLVIGAGSGSKPAGTAESVPAKTLDAIGACFTVAPLRYRLTKAQALANYRKADKLCQQAIAQHPKAPDLWRVRNRRIIALLGMWNLAVEPKYLELAVQEARASLAGNLPAGAEVVPQFCLAKDAFRRGVLKPASVVASFIKATGQNEAPGSALAAGAILASDANDRDLHAKFRSSLLKGPNDNPALWPVVSFLRDRHHTYRMFRATHSRFGFCRTERHSVYRNVAALSAPADTTRLIKTELTTLSGGKFNIPQDTADKLTCVLFMEPPADEESQTNQNTLVQQIIKLADSHPAKRIKVIAAFLSDDTASVRALVKKNEWTCQVGMVPEGIRSPLAGRLGILSADRMPNIFLLRGDGSISWSVSGIIYPVQGIQMAHVIAFGLDDNISVCEMEAAKSVLEKGDFKAAVRLFSEALVTEKLQNDWWATFRFYGRARAHVGLKNWKAALADIDLAIEAHKIFGWKNQVHCGLMVEMQLAKADILDQLGRSAEAKQERQKAAAPVHPHKPSPYGLYVEHRETFRLNPHEGKGAPKR
ncbi:MAG: hypothetical protein HN350_07360 [Phycisphaerales bacterium]|nr:hypothetical protein [Phycisphaerales bacterium]